MKELIKRVEQQILETPTGELRDLLCDVNIMLQLRLQDVNFVHLDAGTPNIEEMRECMKQGKTIFVVSSSRINRIGQACNNTMTIEEGIQKDNSFPISEVLKHVDVTPYQYTREELLDNKPHKHKNKRPYHK